MSSSAAIDLACFHTEGKFVLWGCKDAGRIRCECTGWAIGIIEIQSNTTVFGNRLSIVISAGRISFLIARFIAEFYKQAVVFRFSNIQLI